MKRLLIILMVFAILGLAATLASAQPTGPVPNPTKIEYTVSVDHATLSKYIVGFFLPGATDPVQTADLPIAAPNAEQKIEQPIVTTPLGYGNYFAKMRAVAGTTMSEWSFPSNEFTRVPLSPPSAPIVKR